MQNTQADAQNWFILLAMILFVIAYFYRRPFRPDMAAHGTARLCARQDLRRAGMLQGPGLFLGRELQTGEAIWLKDYFSVLLVGGAGSGKGVGVIVPNLLAYFRSSVVVHDTKGDLFQLTAQYRASKGQRILRLAPFIQGTDKWNPLDSIPRGPLLIDHAKAVAEALAVQPTNSAETDPHWRESAVLFITAILVLVLLESVPEERNLNTVREIASNNSLVDSAADRLIALGGIYARSGHYLKDRRQSEKEYAGIVSTATRYLSFLDSPLVAACVGGPSTFDPRQLHEPGTTLYLSVPPEFLQPMRGLLRLWFATLIRVMSRDGDEASGHVLLLIDEASALGDLPALEEALVRGRSAGCRMLLAYQSDSQVKAAFPSKPTLIYDNCSTQIYLCPPSGYETAEAISKKIGDTTLLVESSNTGESRSWHEAGCHGNESNAGQRSWSASSNFAVQGRPLLKPEEVMMLPTNNMIVFAKGIPPLLCKRIAYFADRYFSGLRSGRKPDSMAIAWWVALAATVAAAAWLLCGK